MKIPGDRWSDALGKFSEGRYFEANEAFEFLWRRAKGPERHFFQGWVLLAAALFHRDRGNAKGAGSCFERAQRHWEGLPPAVAGQDLKGVLEAVEAVLGSEWAQPELPGFQRRAPEPDEWEEEEK